MIQQCVSENARVAQSQADYQKRYNALYKRYDKAKSQLDKLAATKQEQDIKKEVLQRLLADINQQEDILTEFDEELWYATVQDVTVNFVEGVAVTFKDGSIIHIN